MKIRKATIYFYDIISNDNECDKAIEELENLIDRTDLHIDIFKEDIEEIEIGEWDDDIDLNKTDCTKETYEKYFRQLKI